MRLLPILRATLLVAFAFSTPTASALDTTTIFNEVMYHPANAGDSEWIELRNVMSINMDLSGWSISGGVNYTFPEGTVIPAGGHLVIASNPAALQTSAGITGVLGPWTGALNNGGETIRLNDRAARVMDELAYNDKGGWPAGADGSGMSLTRREGHLSGTEPEHWVASSRRGGTPGTENFALQLSPPVEVFGLASPWLYQAASPGLAAGWAASAYTPGTDGWLSGDGVLAFENAALPAPVGTVLTSPDSHPARTYYFQKQFNFSGDPTAVQLSLRTLLDDGAVIYLNGHRVARVRMPSVIPAGSTPASSEVTDADFSDLLLPTTALVNGTNRLSVEVHEAGVPLGKVSDSGGLTLSGLQLEEVGGTGLATNYARQAGATAFAKDLLGNGQYAPTHTIPNLNNGSYGNGSSWIGNSANSFCGISFGATPVSLARIAWSRDNTGTYSDRTAGAYTLEYTAVPNPGMNTTVTGDPATGWALLGTATYPTNGLPYSVRHAFSFAPVMATGIRLTTPGNGLGNGTCIDELEAGPAAPVVPIFDLMATGGTLDSGKDLALTGTAFAKDVIAGFPAHTIPHLNDGLVGNNFSWIGGSANTFCGISFSSAREIGRIAFGRDNTGTYADRTGGIYLVQSTTTANPNGATSDSAWTTIGTILVDASIPSPSLRHVYEFTSVSATGIRLRTPDGACIDELEVYAPESPDVVWGAALTTRDIAPDPAASPLRISEIAGTNAATWKIELQNTGPSPLEMEGIVVAFSGAPNAGYTLPAQTLAPGALLTLDQATLGFRPQPDDRIFLFSAGRAGLMDAAFVKATTRARDAHGRMLVPTADSFDTANPFSLSTDIVFSEIMYHSPPNPSGGGIEVTENPEEWIELHNKGSMAVDLGGWALDEGVNFTFPTGTSLPPGGYLVVARNAAALAQKWPEHAARIVGNFSGSLSNSGERVVLIDAMGNPADEIRYTTSGAWPEAPDGGGTSLELREPRADRNNGHAWAASEESNDIEWQTVSYTMVAGQTFGQTPLWNEFRIGMLDSGECLIDDVSVIRLSDAKQLIQGGDFSSLNTKWRLLGNHGTSAIESEPGNPSNTVLRVRASGPFSWNHNHIETTFVDNIPIVDGQAYTVSFRARWLNGTNQLNTRAYYSRLAKTTELALPTRIGTPGAINSRSVVNVGPTLSALSHSPAIPQATESVIVRVRATDPDGVTTVMLRYALNGSSTYSDVPMTASGEFYSGEIPAQSGGTIVQFYVQSTDNAGAASLLPIAGLTSRALYLVDDEQISNVPAHELRVIMLPADNTDLLAPLNRLSDGRVGGTVIYRRSDVFYDVGVRLQGTAAGRIRDGEAYPGYDIAFPGDHLFRGLHNNVNIDRSGRGPVVRGQDEIYVKHLFHRSGVPCTYDDLVYLIVPNGAHTGTAILQMAGYGSEFVESQFGEGGTVFNLDGTYEPSTTSGNVESLKNPVPLAPQISSDFTDFGADKEQYRGQLDPRSGRRRDDFTGLIAFCKSMAAPNAQLGAQVGTKMDVDEWMHCAAIYSLWGIADCYMTAGFPHNLRLHVPSDGKNITALPWDMDFVMFSAPTSPAILAGGNLLRVINNVPGARHAYYGHLHQLCSTTFTAAYYNTWLQHYGSVVGQTMTGASTYIEARRTSILSQLPATTTFAITTNGGDDFSVSTSTTTLIGTGWINVREIRRSDTDSPLNVTWLTDTSWQADVALGFGQNPITLVAYDFGGLPIANDNIQINSTLPAPSPRDFLRITEVHYHPADPLTAQELAASVDADDFEFVELRNIGTEILDIGWCQFTAGFDYMFPDDTLLAAGEAIVVVRNVSAFQARYGSSIRITGPYGPADRLSDGGETITLRDATGSIIQSFAYGDGNPWPTNADQAGYSLVAIAPQLSLDRTLAIHWRSSVSVGGNPGASDAVVFVGSPTDDTDKDGLNAFLEHALGTSDTAPDPAILDVALEPGGTVLLSFSSRLNADGVDLKIEMGTTLASFAPATATLVQSLQTGSTQAQTWRLTPPASEGKFFTRLRAISR